MRDAVLRNKSTNVRSIFRAHGTAATPGRSTLDPHHAAQGAVRRDGALERSSSIAVSLFARVLPAATARWAIGRFLTPPAPRPVTPRVQELFARAADQFFVEAELPWAGHRERTRARLTLWGRGPTLYFLHGWGGRASQFASFVEPLVAAGFTVAVLDAPGHGEVSARTSSVLHFAAVLRAAVDSLGPARLLIGHSLGGAAVAYALRAGLAADGAVFIGTPRAPGDAFGHFLGRAGIDARLHPRIIAEAERQLGSRFGDLLVRAPPERAPLPVLLIHDRDDTDVRYDDALATARDWPHAKLMTTSGLGHHRVLRDAGVIDAIRDLART